MFERTGEKFNFKSYARGLNHCEERYYHVSEFLRKQGVTKVLDVGCNTGNFLLAMTRVAEMERLVGLDMDEECLAESRGKLLSPEDIQYKLLYERPLPLTVSLYKGSILQRPVGFE
jgi:ubiquinone/menaquinone biosynthesis C-methylase UbiE